MESDLDEAGLSDELLEEVAERFRVRERSVGECDEVSPATSARIAGLANGVKYRVRVVAVNEAGAGKAPPAKVAAPRRNKPGVPRSLVLSPVDGQINVSWVAPADDGGTPVIDYVIQYSLNGIDWVTFGDDFSATTAASVLGLMNGTKYWVRVAAVNLAGSSPFTPAKTAYPVFG